MFIVFFQFLFFKLCTSIIYEDDTLNSLCPIFLYYLSYLILFSIGDTGHPCISDLSRNALPVSWLFMVLSLGCDIIYLVKEASM